MTATEDKPKTYVRRLMSFICDNWDPLKISKARWVTSDHIEISFAGELRVYSILDERDQDARMIMRRARDILGGSGDYSALEKK